MTPNEVRSLKDGEHSKSQSLGHSETRESLEAPLLWRQGRYGFTLRSLDSILKGRLRGKSMALHISRYAQTANLEQTLAGKKAVPS